jgi:hypothetical protein
MLSISFARFGLRPASSAAVFSLALALLLSSPHQMAQAQTVESPTNHSGVKSVFSDSPSPAKAPASPFWPPLDVAKAMPPVAPGRPCPLPEVLAGAGLRIRELTRNVDRFTATELVQHQSVDGAGKLQAPQIRKFDYIVSMAQKAGGFVRVEEYRNHAGLDQFPDHIATLGTPALVMIFHPDYVKAFQVTCEGLGQWRGNPAWQLRFEEARSSRTSISTMEIGHQTFPLRLRGRAWILADSYQVARLETDLADEIPQIRLRLQHQEIEYRPVPVPENKSEIWLPSSSELYMDFRGHRFFRRHSFTDIELFSVKVQQTIGQPKELSKTSR